MTKIAIHAITKKGYELAQRLQCRVDNAQVFVIDRSGTWGGEKANVQPLSAHLRDCFSRFDQHIFIFSVGIATRMLAPLLKDKRSDPGVTCIDESGQFVVPVLSGHRGGANEIASSIAKAIKAQAVITTASDSSKTLSVDMMGQPLGWTLAPESEGDITCVSSAVVNSKKVLIWQQSGEKNWWPYSHRMPSHLTVCESEIQPEFDDYSAVVVISNRLNSVETLVPHVIWRPRNIELGIGCDRNTPESVLKKGLTAFLKQHNLHPASIAGLHSVSLKSDELGILTLAEDRSLPFNCYDAAVLSDVEGIENPSATVLKCIGISSVAEAAALHGAKRNKLLVPKFKFAAQGFNMTLAACERQEEEPLLARKLKNILGESNAVSAHSHGHSHGRSHGSQRTIATKSIACDAQEQTHRHQDLSVRGSVKPIRQYAHHLFICEGGRCQDEGATGLAHYLRQIIKSMNLGKGEKRIKVTRSHCVGACRQRATAAIYARNSSDPNHSIWLQSLEHFSEAKWREVLLAISACAPLEGLLEPHYLAEVENS